ncbi:hypothetical protein PIB30_109093, partial [Stylosanthes scabra]|nr:hypothetical protein [Stylosanthes scabra]
AYKILNNMSTRVRGRDNLTLSIGHDVLEVGMLQNLLGALTCRGTTAARDEDMSCVLDDVKAVRGNLRKVIDVVLGELCLCLLPLKLNSGLTREIVRMLKACVLLGFVVVGAS